jgi:NAD(P)-dependent dehydrogenase (short-subunit alcohol dehydrogenase family)
MRVLITGGNGGVGKVVTQHLVTRGWDVRVVDLQSEGETRGAEYVQCDIMDYDALRNSMRGCEAIVHLAAIPTPATLPGHDVFRVNVAGTFNVFEAAAAEGIRRITQASSINALGCAWGPAEIVVEYFPIDEEHPTHPSDPYSLSKRTVEDIGAYYWRRDGISSVALRLPWVWRGDQDQAARLRARFQTDREMIDAFAALPAAERHARLTEAKRLTLDYRSQRRMEYPKADSRLERTRYFDNPLWRMYAFDRFNLWAIVDARDAAQAFEKGLTTGYEGSHALFINAAQNWLGYDTRTLVALFFPDVNRWKKPVSGAESLVCIDKARQLIGFEPDYSPDMFAEGQAG